MLSQPLTLSSTTHVQSRKNFDGGVHDRQDSGQKRVFCHTRISIGCKDLLDKGAYPKDPMPYPKGPVISGGGFGPWRREDQQTMVQNLLKKEHKKWT